MQFQRATKAKATARVALAGPAGAGKTYTSLALATAFAADSGGRVAVIDTERGSASKYADEFEFDTLELTSFHPDRLVQALGTAADAGYRTVVIDSLSHFWMGTGGMLELADANAKAGNTFAGWKAVRPIERGMIDAITAYPGHVVACLRTKVAYEVQTNDRGKKEPVKLGQRPEQREGIEYEFDIVGEMHDGTLSVTKARARSLTGAVVTHPGAEFAGAILEWLNAGVEHPAAVAYRDRALAPEATLEDLRNLLHEVRVRGLYAAIVTGPDGEQVALGQLVTARGKALAAANGGGVSDAA